ncbi:hypothetical protein RF11_04720 [Thelohanellus kitauei]|uniref:Uncharacterized protein n=1 Tax=Thelohanellus kitauei TaxID=669202 RepID=A0A0C2MJW0_THEKT|nr:hypothetical protein RF11_04720 [Thelohanellus kitauei]
MYVNNLYQEYPTSFYHYNCSRNYYKSKQRDQDNDEKTTDRFSESFTPQNIIRTQAETLSGFPTPTNKHQDMANISKSFYTTNKDSLDKRAPFSDLPNESNLDKSMTTHIDRSSSTSINSTQKPFLTSTKGSFFPNQKNRLDNIKGESGRIRIDLASMSPTGRLNVPLRTYTLTKFYALRIYIEKSTNSIIEEYASDSWEE